MSSKLTLFEWVSFFFIHTVVSVSSERTCCSLSLFNESKDNVQHLEDCILKVITKIKKDRSRPCYQNILNFVNRRRNTLEIAELKNLIDNLMARNVM